LAKKKEIPRRFPRKTECAVVLGAMMVLTGQCQQRAMGPNILFSD
jgi:hypothetical protein